MKALIFKDGFGKPPIEIECSQVIVVGQYNNPIMVGLEYANGGVHVTHVDDDNFNQTLRQLGIDRFVVVDTLQELPVPEGSRLIRGPGV